LTGRDFFWGLQDIVASNKKIQSPAQFHNWIADNYVAKVSTSIVRLTDRHKGTVSLYWLIRGIANNPDVITRDYFVSQWCDERSKQMGMANRMFDMFAEPGEQSVDQDMLKSDIEKLVEGTRLVRDYRDEWIAHFDQKRETTQMTTFGDLDKALDIIDEVWCKCSLLLTCSAPNTCKPARQYNWKKTLRHAWIQGTE